MSATAASHDPDAPSAPRRAVLEVLAAAALFGTTGTTASFAPPSASPPSIGAARLVVGGAGLLAILPWAGGTRRTAIRLWRTPWAFLGGLMVAAYQLTFFAGVDLAGVAVATLVTIGTGPIIVGLLSWPLLREPPTPVWWASTAIAVCGLALLALDGTTHPGGDPAGIVLALGAATAYAIYTVAARRTIVAGHGPADVMGSIFGLGALLVLPVLIATGAAWLATPEGLVVALWLGLATTTVAYLLFGRGLRVLPAGPAATLVLAEPLVATLLGVGLLGERPGAAGWAGAALVAIGLLLQGAASARGRARTGPSGAGA